MLAKNAGEMQAHYVRTILRAHPPCYPNLMKRVQFIIQAQGSEVELFLFHFLDELVVAFWRFEILFYFGCYQHTTSRPVAERIRWSIKYTVPRQLPSTPCKGVICIDVYIYDCMGEPLGEGGGA